MKPRRHPLDKEHWLEGNRQKWVAIGLLLTLLFLLCNILFHVDPAPYLQAVMLLIGAGVLGWSVDSAVKAYRIDSSQQTLNQTINTPQNSGLTTLSVNPRREPKDYDLPLSTLY